MSTYSLEDPIEYARAGEQLPPGNPQGLRVDDVAALTGDYVCNDGRTLAAMTKVVVRAITPLPTTYLAMFEPVDADGPTGECFEIQLPLLAKT